MSRSIWGCDNWETHFWLALNLIGIYLVLIIPWWTGQPPPQRIFWPQMSIVLRLTNLNLTVNDHKAHLSAFLLALPHSFKGAAESHPRLRQEDGEVGKIGGCQSCVFSVYPEKKCLSRTLRRLPLLPDWPELDPIKDWAQITTCTGLGTFYSG